jgi:hypothetical protein
MLNNDPQLKLSGFNPGSDDLRGTDLHLITVGTEN